MINCVYLEVNVKSKTTGKSHNLGLSSKLWPKPETTNQWILVMESVKAKAWLGDLADYGDDLVPVAEFASVVPSLKNQLQIAYNSHPECIAAKRAKGYGKAEFTLTELKKIAHDYAMANPDEAGEVLTRFYGIEGSTKGAPRIEALTAVLEECGAIDPTSDDEATGDDAS